MRRYFEFGAVQRCVNLVDLEKMLKMHNCMLKSALMQPRKGPLKNADLEVGTCT